MKVLIILILFISYTTSWASSYVLTRYKDLTGLTCLKKSAVGGNFKLAYKEVFNNKQDCLNSPQYKREQRIKSEEKMYVISLFMGSSVIPIQFTNAGRV